jgi:hypothetical protein
MKRHDPAIYPGTGRPVYSICAETRADPAEPRMHLAICVNGTVADQWALARYQSHGAAGGLELSGFGSTPSAQPTEPSRIARRS